VCQRNAEERLVSGYTVNSQDVCMFEKRVMCLWIKISVEKVGIGFTGLLKNDRSNLIFKKF
jgi:hypothetical protein